jgi:hypothetical protein
VNAVYDDYLYESNWSLRSLSTCAVEAWTKLPSLIICRRIYYQLGSWYRIVILDSVAGDMCFGYGDRSAVLYATVDVSDALITSSTDVRS